MFYPKRFLIPFLVLLTCLVACTATFNWREVRFDEQNFVALLPAKHRFEQQTIRFGEQELTMTMVASRAGEIIFAVGTIPFDPKNTSGEEMIGWMSLNAKNILKDNPSPPIIQYEVKTASNPALILPAKGYQLKGFGPDGIYRVYWVRWIFKQNPTGQSYLYQLNAIQSFKTEPSDSDLKATVDQMETFMIGFHPY
jgi:hypothetical protein